jgi:protease-4
MNEIPPVVTPVESTPKKNTGLKIYAILMTVFLMLSLAANVVLVMVSIASVFGQIEEHRVRQLLREEIVGGDEKSSHKIVVIDINGLISADGPEDGMVGEVKKRLDAALKDDRVKAIVLKVDSPGGEVTASDTIYEAVKQARVKKPVVAHIGALGASGAYYVSMGASHVIASDTSVTASIGVIAQSLNVADLFQKIGVEAYTFKSGKNKDLLNPFRKATPEELEEQRKIVQGLIDEMYEKFLGIVATERKLEKEQLRAGLADGRVMTGRQAEQAKLVDEVGGFESAVETAKKLAGIKDAQQVKYIMPFSLSSLMSLFASRNTPPTVQVEVWPKQFRLEAGKLYYLSHHMVY